MGIGCTREGERVQTACGELNGAIAVFSPNSDVKSAGILFSLPSLLVNGLLKYCDQQFSLTKGERTNLPKRYVAREKLCLRGVTDYWINDSLGQPFFVITQTVNTGLLAVLREKIIPELLEEIPKQPTQEELGANPHLSRFGIVFDREGYSPIFFKQMWEKRIACYTYQKYAHEDWPESEFEEKEVVFPNGEVASIKLAERGVYSKILGSTDTQINAFGSPNSISYH